MIHKSWDINEHATGRFKDGKPIMGATFQNGLNDIETDGSFVPCDMGIEEYHGNVTTHKVKRGRYGKLGFTDKASSNKHMCKLLQKDGNGQSIKYIDADSGLPDVSNGNPKFLSDNGITIEHTPTYKGVKIELVIDDPATAPLEYTFSVKDYGQAYDFTKVNGAIIATGADGKKITYHAPYITDANGEIGTAHYVLLGRTGGYFQFKKVVDDEAWLRQAAAPVRIDPDITIEDGVDGGVIEDADMNGFAAGVNYGVSTFLFHQNNVVGWDWLIKTVVSGLGIGTITLVKYVFLCDLAATGGGYACQFRQLLRDWNEGNKSGSAASTGEVTAASARHNEQAWTTTGAKGAGTDYDNVDITASFNTPTSTGSFDVVMDNDIWQARVDGGTNYGDVLHAVTDSGGKNFQINSSEGATPPQLYIEYTEAAGVVIFRRRMEDY